MYFIDADDFVELDTIEYLYNIIKEKRVLISTCRPLTIYNYNYKIENEKEEIETISSKEMLKKILRTGGLDVVIWNKLIKREIFNNIRFEDRLANDVVIMHKIVIYAKIIGYSNQIKYFYFRHSNSIVALNKDDRFLDLHKANIERYYYIKNIYPDLVENELRIYQWIINAYVERNYKVRQYLKKDGALKFYNQIFRFKNISKARWISKIKFILFRINPKLCRFVIKSLRHKPVLKIYYY